MGVDDGGFDDAQDGGAQGYYRRGGEQDPTQQEQPDGEGPDSADHDAGTAGGAQPQVFPDLDTWVRTWFAPCVSMRLTGEGRGLTWCPSWWEHTPVAVRLHALWQAWEATVAGTEGTAMARWWVQLAEPMLRIICNGETGPMWQCTTAHHYPEPTLPTIQAPAGWLNISDGRGPQVGSGDQW